MSVRYLIDGYNLLFALPEMPSGSWQHKREQLVSFLKNRRPQGRNPATVVFDSREGLGNSSQDGDMTLVFTAGETADDWIIAKVRHSANPRDVVVVSNDLGIRTMIRGTGAKFLGATEFLKAASPTTPRRQRYEDLPSSAQDITDELKKKWLP